jgi:hypothetical protein
MRPLILSLVTALVLVFAATASSSGGATANVQILASLNAERAANGIPIRVRENTAWSSKCAKHVAYIDATGQFGHTEDASSPASTADGRWAGANSVLAMGATWRTGNPFATAPLHLIQLLSPELRRLGVDESASGTICMTTFAGYNASGWKKPAVYSVPGDGAVGVPYAETAQEFPYVPGDFVGLPRGTETGFNVMVFAEGIPDPWHAHIAAATLTGPAGPVELRTVDRTTPVVGDYLPPGAGFLIPVAPLAPGTTYTASVTFAESRAQRTWRFTTAPPHVVP